MRSKRYITILLSVALLISFMISPVSAAADDPIRSYKYFSFSNPGAVTGSSYEWFDVQGMSDNTSNVIFILCSRSASIQLISDISSSYYDYPVTVSTLWENSSVTCYRLVSDSARIFTRDFSLRVYNSSGNAGAFNVYKIFTVAAGGILKQDSTGVMYRTGYVTPSMTPSAAQSIESFPFVYQSDINSNSNNRFFLDIMIPISKFAGMQQGSFSAYANSLNSTKLDLGSYLQSFTLLYNGAPIPFSYSTVQTTDSIGGLMDFDGTTDEGVVRPIGNHLNVIFDVPEQLPSNDLYLIARFVYICDDTAFHFYFQDLWGRYSFAKSEYELMYDIYNILSSFETDMGLIKGYLSSIQTQLQMSNEWFFGIWDELAHINTFVQTIRAYLINLYNNSLEFFVDVGNWFFDLGSLVVEWGGNIVTAITGDDGGAAEEFKEDAQQQAGEVESGVGKIDAVQKPNVNDIESDPNEILDSSAVGLFAGTINIFFQNNIFYSIFSLVLLMMLASYVLFGKK